MKRIFISSVQKEFESERAAIKRMIESDPILKPHFNVFVFEIDAPASDKSTQQVYLGEIEKSDIYLVLIGNRYGYCREGELSPTEREFDRAKELGLTKLVMVRGTDNSKREEREARFLDKVSKERVRVRYQDTEPRRLHRAITVAELYKKHESFATNPRIARAMYQVKYIETIGTGLTDLLKDCKAKGLRKPLLEEISGRFRIVIWRPKSTAHMAGNLAEGSQKTPQKGSLKSSLKILRILAAEPTCTYEGLAERIGISRRAITKQIKNLRETGKLKRIGPDKGGHWEVIEKLES